MATGTIFVAPWFTAEDGNGKPISGALLNFFIAGTTTPATTYSDVALTIANVNPVVADGYGRAGPIFGPPGLSVKLVLTDASSVVIRTQDNLQFTPTSSNNIDISGTAGQSLSASTPAYLSDGSGGKTAGQWYPTDVANSYSSSTPIVGMTTAAIASGSSGTFRIGGQVTGLASLTPGTTYYLGTSGAITASPQANRRPIGEADSTSSLVIFQQPTGNSAVVDLGLCEFRLTLTTGTPVTTSDVTAATTIFCTPYQGNRIALYDSAGVPTIYAASEFSIAVPASTSQMYDVFAYSNAGVATLELLAWTNDTTRATALTTQDGVLVKTGVLTRRYVGSFRTTTVSGQTEDSAAKRFVWNYYNRVRRVVSAMDATNTWTYTTATYRQANGNPANQVALVQGVAESPLDLRVVGEASNTGTAAAAYVAIGEDSTSAGASGQLLAPMSMGVAAAVYIVTAALSKVPAVGYHFYAWLEQSTPSGTTTWYGDNNNPTLQQAGLLGWIEG